MKKISSFIIAFASLSTIACTQSTGPELKKATDHPIQYYISLPDNWKAQSTWPVVVVASDAEKQFKKNAERFMEARKSMPFILVVPCITTNGQQGHRDPAVYPYTQSVWDTIDKISICQFDISGLQSIIRDVKEKYHGSDKIFLTGFEAGAHLVWAMAFQHPELLYAAAPVAGNYRSRCMETGSFSKDDSGKQLAIKNFIGSDDKDFGKDGRIYYQYLEAKNAAVAHGYQNISETVVKGKGHILLPDEVLEYFQSIWKTHQTK